MASSSGYDFKSAPKADVDSLIKKYSVLTPSLLQQTKLPERLKRFQKKEKPKETELSEEIITDLKVLRMRSVLDTKRFYKRSALKNMTTKDIQVGKVVDSPVDFYSSRLTNKERKRTLVDELLADQNFKQEVKKRYVNIVTTHKRKFKNDFTKLKRKESKGQPKNKKKKKEKKLF